MNDSVAGLQDRGPDPLPRPRPLRRQRRPGRGAAADRHGLPETEPVPEVDLRQRRLGAAQPRPEARTSTSGSSRRCAARRSGTRSRTGSRTAPSASPAASSSGSASPARSRSSPTCCCSTSPPRRSTRSPPASIEDLMHSLKGRFTIVIVTHNMQQAARVADRTAFFSLDSERRRAGRHADRVRRHRDDLHAARPTRARATTSPAASAERAAGLAVSGAGSRRPRPARAAAGRTASRRWRRCCAGRRRTRRSRRCRSPPCAGSVRPRSVRRRRPGGRPRA